METLNLPRANLPQVRDKEAFKDWLTKHNISWTVAPNYPAIELKPTQFDFDYTKVDNMSQNPEKHRHNPVIVAQDCHICDGHHRWAGILRADPAGTIAVLMVNVPIQNLLGLAHQFLGDTQALNIKEMTTQDPNLLFEEMFPEADDPTKPGDLKPGDPGYVLRRLKKVPIHTSNEKPTMRTVSTSVGTEYDKISPGQVAESDDDDESGKVPGDTVDNDAQSSVSNSIPEVYKDPRQVLRKFFNTKNATQGKPPVLDRERPVNNVPHSVVKPGNGEVKEDTQVPTRTHHEIEDIKAKYKDKRISWSDAHKELLHRGMSVSDIPKHLGESKDMNLLQKNKNCFKERKGKTQSGGTKDRVDVTPSLKIFPANTI